MSDSIVDRAAACYLTCFCRTGFKPRFRLRFNYSFIYLLNKYSYSMQCSRCYLKLNGCFPLPPLNPPPFPKIKFSVLNFRLFSIYNAFFQHIYSGLIGLIFTLKFASDFTHPILTILLHDLM